MAQEQKQYLLTQEGIDKLKEELRVLIDVKRPQVIKAIQEAREQGDLSENADYDAAKNNQAEIEGRIKEINDALNYAQVIEDQPVDNSKRVKVGSKVTIHDLNEDKNFTYEIVGEFETNPDEDKISNQSPLAKAILNKTVGVTTEVHGIEEPYRVKIIKIHN
jgi:transcription elongation factor GreA